MASRQVVHPASIYERGKQTNGHSVTSGPGDQDDAQRAFYTSLCLVCEPLFLQLPFSVCTVAGNQFTRILEFVTKKAVCDKNIG